MKPLEQLKQILSNEYTSEDGDKYSVELLPGMSEDEIKEFRGKLPNSYIPSDIEELLKFSKGFSFFGFDEILFDAYGQFGFEDMFPRSIQLAGDGFGNFWVLDIDSNGNWGSVYYVCHDPAVIVKHSIDLVDFIKHIDEFGKNEIESHLNLIHDKIVFDIWKSKIGIMEKNEKDYNFPEEFIKKLPKSFMVADLTNTKTGTGFAWGKYGPNAKIFRFEDKPIWIIEKRVKQNFLAKLFGSKD